MQSACNDEQMQLGVDPGHVYLYCVSFRGEQGELDPIPADIWFGSQAQG